MWIYFTLIYITGAIIDLYKDGGARPQGIDNNVDYDGILNLIPKTWFFFSAILAIKLLLNKNVVFSKLPKYFASFMGYIILSSFWADYIGPALFGSFQLLFIFIIIFGSINALGVKNFSEHVIYFLDFIIISSIIFSIFIPSWGVSVNSDSLGAWQGVFFHKNLLGGFCVTALILQLMWHQDQRGIYRKLIITLALLNLFGSQSSTSIFMIGVLLFALILFKFYSKNIPLLSFFIVTTTIFVMYFIMNDIINNGGASLPSLSKDELLSGRPAIWLYIADKIMLQPIFGYGFSQLSLNNAAESEDFIKLIGVVVSSAHNGYLNLIYEAGIVGLILYCIAIPLSLRSKNNNACDKWIVSYLAVYLVINMFESRLVGFNLNYFVLVYFLAVKSYKVAL